MQTRPASALKTYCSRDDPSWRRLRHFLFAHQHASANHGNHALADCEFQHKSLVLLIVTIEAHVFFLSWTLARLSARAVWITHSVLRSVCVQKAMLEVRARTQIRLSWRPSPQITSC